MLEAGPCGKCRACLTGREFACPEAWSRATGGRIVPTDTRIDAATAAKGLRIIASAALFFRIARYLFSGAILWGAWYHVHWTIWLSLFGLVVSNELIQRELGHLRREVRRLKGDR